MRVHLSTAHRFFTKQKYIVWKKKGMIRGRSCKKTHPLHVLRLIQCETDNDQTTLEKLKKVSFNPNCRDRAGHTPMTMAAAQGKTAVLMYVHGKGGDPVYCQPNGHDILSAAVCNGHYETARCAETLGVCVACARRKYPVEMDLYTAVYRSVRSRCTCQSHADTKCDEREMHEQGAPYSDEHDVHDKGTTDTSSDDDTIDADTLESVIGRHVNDPEKALEIVRGLGIYTVHRLERQTTLVYQKLLGYPNLIGFPLSYCPVCKIQQMTSSVSGQYCSPVCMRRDI